MNDVIRMRVERAELESGGEGIGVSTGEGSDASEDFTGRGGRLFFKSNQRMAQESEGARGGFRSGVAELAFFLTVEEEILAQFEKQGAEIALDLDAMEIHGDGDVFYDVGARENTTVSLHVEEFDGEYISRAAKFFGGEAERGGFVLVLSPPVNHRGDAG